MKKIISIFCVVLVVFCCMNLFEQKSQALFSEAVTISLIGSILLSIALSEGIAVATGTQTAFDRSAEELYNYFQSGAAGDDVDSVMQRLQLYGSLVYQGGKLYFALNKNGYNFFKSWISGVDWDNLHYQANLTVSTLDFIQGGSSYSLNNITGRYSIGIPNSVVSFTTPSYSIVALADGSCSLTLSNDGFTVYNSYTLPSGALSLIVTDVNRNGNSQLFVGKKIVGSSLRDADPDSATNTGSRNIGYVGLFAGTRASYNGESVSFNYTSVSNGYRVLLDDELIAVVSNILDYQLKCYSAGCILTNISNSVTDVNTNSDVTSVSTPIETEAVAPAIPNNNGIGRNQVALIPVPGNTVDAEDESIVLSPGEVKKYDREGKDYTFIPVPFQLYGKTGADLGVTVMNKTEFEETSNPVYVPDYPDVFPTASPDVTITAGADVFPTVAPTEAPTAGEGSTADAIAGDIADIKDELGDLSTPLTPPQAQDGTNKLRLPTLLLQKFPFCIPYDFYNGINQFKGEAETPQFDIPFEWEFFGRQLSYNIHIDFSSMTTLAKICQWFFSVAWVVALILLTRKVVWK